MLQLKNYPSGDPEFDKWFREMEPDAAKEIDLQIEKESVYQDLVAAAKQALSWMEHDDRGQSPLANNLRKVIKRAQKIEKG